MLIIKRIFLLCFTMLFLSCSEQDVPDKYWNHTGSGALAAVISQDASLALVSSNAHGLILWDLKTNAQRHRWNQGDNNLVLFTDISANNKYAVSADKTSFIVWDIATGKALTYTRVRESAIRDIVIANNGDLLIGKVNGVVVHVNIFSGRRIEFLGHSEKINSIDMSPNGRYALSGSNDYSALLWDTQSGQVIQRFIHPSRVSKVALDPRGRYAFTADSKRLSAIWDLKTGKEISRLQYSSRSRIFSAVRFSRDGKQLFTGTPGRLLNRWEVTSGQQLQQWQVLPRAETRPPSSVIFSIAETQSGKLVTESSSGFAEFWRYENKS
jgi:WD40 repeat protein